MSNITDPPILDSTGQRIAIALEAMNFGRDLSYFSQPSTSTPTGEISSDILSESTGKRIASALENVVNNPAGLKTILNIEDTDDKIYGFEEAYNVQNPDRRITYIGANENWDPITIDAGGGYDLGNWENFEWLKQNKPYMIKKDGTIDYALDPNDYTKKLDGTPSDISNTNYDGAGAFSWGAKIYKKEIAITENGSEIGRRVGFSFKQHEGFKPIGFFNKYDHVLEGRWIPMFYGSIINDEAKTIGGVVPAHGYNDNPMKLYDVLNSIGVKDDNEYGPEIIENPHANVFGGSFVQTLIDLMIMFAKTTNLNKVYGFGVDTSFLSRWERLTQPIVNGGMFYKGEEDASFEKVFHSLVLGSYAIACVDPYIAIHNNFLYTNDRYVLDLSTEKYAYWPNFEYLSTSYFSSTSIPQFYKEAGDFGSIGIEPFVNTNSATDIYGCDSFIIPSRGSQHILIPSRFGHEYSMGRYGPRHFSFDINVNPGIETKADLPTRTGFAVLMDPPPQIIDW